MISLALISFGVGMWMRQRKQKAPRWQRWIEEAIKSYEGRQYNATVEQAQKALKAIQKSDPETNVYHGLIYFYIGRANLDAHQLEAARTALLKCEKLYLTHPPEQSMYQNNLDLALADLYFESGDFSSARPYYSNTLKRLEEDADNENASQVRLVVYQRLAELSEQERDYSAAVAYYQSFLVAFEEEMGEDHPGYKQLARHQLQLKSALEAQQRGYPKERISIAYNENEEDFISRHFAKWLVSPNPNPSQASLNKLLQQSDQLRILKGSPIKMDEIKLISNGSELGPIKATLRIEKEPQGHAMRNEGTCFQWEDQSGKILGQLWYLGEGILRWEGGWKDDARLEWADRFELRLEEFKALPN